MPKNQTGPQYPQNRVGLSHRSDGGSSGATSSSASACVWNHDHSAPHGLCYPRTVSHLHPSAGGCALVHVCMEHLHFHTYSLQNLLYFSTQPHRLQESGETFRDDAFCVCLLQIHHLVCVPQFYHERESLLLPHALFDNQGYVHRYVPGFFHYRLRYSLKDPVHMLPFARYVPYTLLSSCHFSIPGVYDDNGTVYDSFEIVFHGYHYQFLHFHLLRHDIPSIPSSSLCDKSWIF